MKNVFSDNAGFPVPPENKTLTQSKCFILVSGEPDSHTWGVYGNETTARRVKKALEDMGHTAYLTESVIWHRFGKNNFIDWPANL